MIEIKILLENTACRGDLFCRHGLSIYARTDTHQILFDMGPDASLLSNADALGVALEEIDTAILSHGHSDHGGGLEAFFSVNHPAPVYLRHSALEGHYSLSRSPEPRYIGLTESVKASPRLRFAGDVEILDKELTLFSLPPRESVSIANRNLRRKVGDACLPEDFRHETNLLIRSGDKAVLLAGCAHNGIVPILERCMEILGRAPDAVFGGFHLHAPSAGTTEAPEVVAAIAARLAQWPTQYYTGHCTGEIAYAQLRQVLGDRLHPMQGGLVVTV